ncbi:cupin domain-containing protein [Pseudidiomarina sp.]|uniref:cupin domain-containing protein n=1 Tax=Pseudidiomarina sp. TaxID=2081707 RepID=UPI003A979D3A
MSLKLNIDHANFLRESWQQHPRLIRGAFKNFDDLIEPEILAGLALEEGVDSRVIENHAGTWNVTHGPFESYDEFGEAGWTLLVQSVNEWVPEVQQLIAPFRFLPDWRIDDVMISFATEHGGVGPHLDQYDVFIIQGSGRRHWQVGARVSAANEICPHPDLKQLADTFEPIIDAILEPGDMLYIPAGCPHNGVALEPSINYSVGFRAPNTAELGASVTDMLSQLNDVQLPRYRDAQASSYGAPHHVTAEQLQHVREFLLNSMSSIDLDHAMLLVLSQSKRPLPQPEGFIQAEELVELLSQPTDVYIARTPGARILIGPNADQLYANGESWPLNNDVLPLAEFIGELWQDTALTDLIPVLQNKKAVALCRDLINNGVIDVIAQQD